MSYCILGIMSGSSLDGLDLAITSFDLTENLRWNIEWSHSEPLTHEWKEVLKNIKNFPLEKYFYYNTTYGIYLGEIVKKLTENVEYKLDAVAIHGHTVIHDPLNKFTVQLGSPAHIANGCQLPVISDFRSADMALGGQGAPLAHMADSDLFPGHDFYLNIGGIANMSIKREGQITSSFDVCGANQILNRLAQEKGQEYDQDGMIARQGKVFKPLLNKLLNHPYLSQKPPKSLDNQYTVQEFFNPFKRIHLSTEDKLATAVEWIARCIAQTISINSPNNLSLFLSGGGAFNKFLVERIDVVTLDRIKVFLPNKEIIEYKEAILMGYLGALRVQGEPNCRCIVTGADRDSINGQIYLPSP